MGVRWSWIKGKVITHEKQMFYSKHRIIINGLIKRCSLDILCMQDMHKSSLSINNFVNQLLTCDPVRFCEVILKGNRRQVLSAMSVPIFCSKLGCWHYKLDADQTAALPGLSASPSLLPILLKVSNCTANRCSRRICLRRPPFHTISLVSSPPENVH